MNRDDVQDLQEAIAVLRMSLDHWTGSDRLSPIVDTAVREILKHLGKPPDITHRHLSLSDQTEVHVLYFSQAVDEELVVEGILTPLQHVSGPLSPQCITVGALKAVSTLRDALKALLANQAVIGATGWRQWWAVDVSSPPQRSVQEPSNAQVIHGPHTGFVEHWGVNAVLIRNLLRTPFLRMEELHLGFWTQSTVIIFSIEGLTPAALVRWARLRLRQVSMRGLVDSSRLAMALGGPIGIPTLQYTERPDQMVAALLQRRVAIMLDGSPTVLLAPARLPDLLNHPGDYYQLPLTGTFTRWLRYGAIAIATTLPAVYVAALTVNPSFIPLTLYLTTIRTRLAIPFPVLIETVIMLAAVDLVQEAGLVMPGALGQTVTIFGTLILGDAAIKAGLVAAPTLITVTLAVLGQFLIPDANLANVVRLVRYALLPLAAVFGLIGIVSGWLMLMALGTRQRSAGSPYFSPLAPWRPGGWRDTLMRWPNDRRKRAKNTA